MADLALSILISDGLSIVEYVGDSIELHPSDNHFDCIGVTRSLHICGALNEDDT
jgi:hypothetical protein